MEDFMTKLRLTLAAAAALFATLASPALAQNIPYNANPTVRVGQTVILKGVRGECGQQPLPFNRLTQLPRPNHGRLSAGRVGTIVSNSCGGPTPALEIRYTGTSPGTESFTVYNDRFTITVVPR
jgi:hypothetical protein